MRNRAEDGFQERRNLRDLVVGKQGVRAVPFPIGSDAQRNPQVGVENIVIPMSGQGIVVWVQHPQRNPLELMNLQPQYHPALGLGHDGKGHISFNEQRFYEAGVSLLEGSIDFHPDAAAGYHALRNNAERISPNAVLVKTQVASPSCSAQAWPRTVEESLREAVQDLLYPSLMRGHLQNLSESFPGLPIVVSIDDPASQSEKEASRNFSRVFPTDSDIPPVLRAYHDCNGPHATALIREGVVDIMHIDAQKFHPAALLTDGETLYRFLEGEGMFAIGAVPQQPNDLETLARGLGSDFDGQWVRQIADYDTLAEFLGEKMEDAVESVANTFRKFVTGIITAEGSKKHSDAHVSDLCFLTTACGLGTVKNDNLRAVTYALWQKTSQKIRDGK